MACCVVAKSLCSPEGALLLDAGRLTREATEVVNPCTTHFTGFHDFNGFEEGASQWEDTLHTDAGGHFPNREGLGRAFAFALNNSSLKDLSTLFLALFNLVADFHRITGFEVRPFFQWVELLGNLTKTIHDAYDVGPY